MVFDLLKLNIAVSDDEFNSIYPENISALAAKNWTPMSIAKSAAEFLAEKPGTRVLDIGSGAGKFCLIGAACTKGHFTGVEQRPNLVQLSTKLSASYDIQNIKFIHANIVSLKFADYQAFYFYNSFFENIDKINRIDDAIALDADLYHVYSIHVFEQFNFLPPGTRVVTYCSPVNLVPQTFKLQASSDDGLLKFLEKVE